MSEAKIVDHNIDNSVNTDGTAFNGNVKAVVIAFALIAVGIIAVAYHMAASTISLVVG